MAIQLSKKQSDLEKRLQLLRHQVYGKRDNIQSATVLRNEITEDGRPREVSDIKYLYQDLLKILTLSSIAIGAQVILYYLKFF